MDLEEKINNLNPEQKKNFGEELMVIYEHANLCRFYGAKDPINLPKTDAEIIREKLYKEMFESYNVSDNQKI